MNDTTSSPAANASEMQALPPHAQVVQMAGGHVLAQAIYALADWRHDPFYRDAYKARLVDYQFLGKPYHLSLFGARRFQGGMWSAELTHPFFTDVQRAAWRVVTGDEHSYLGLRRGPRPGGSRGTRTAAPRPPTAAARSSRRR